MPEPVELFTNFDRHPRQPGSMTDLMTKDYNSLIYASQDFFKYLFLVRGIFFYGPGLFV